MICDESTLTTAGGILAVKDYGIGREKLKSRLYGRYKMNITDTGERTISPGEKVIPFNNQVWFSDTQNLVDIASSTSNFTITANQEMALRVSVFVSVTDWASPSGGNSLVLKVKKNDAYFGLDHFIVQNDQVIGNGTISIRGATLIYLNEDDELNIVIENNSSGDVFLLQGDAGSNISFEEI